ncbi:ORF MSV146 hypothetical protein [Melanoplus sanguinipes entomopoxvirus]|uniref:F-box domain-containing protein n=1 Tax=Melanoplus sanguinipes entomopoxvirus TaxID=83191 RepID=Q9YVU6_MSEPV|nr:ORF MSV146 hypothetical protein [Melanoplus sanguinipes entomopoxvirus]AAC97673.1 ORF MSV146 hypothetical protein [Melanoplus sanguinipes entomopoxvirus 'O']
MSVLNKYTIEYICKYLSPNSILNLSLVNKHICSIIHNELYNINYKISNRKYNRLSDKFELFLNINTFNIIRNTISYNLTSLSISNIRISDCCISQLYNLKNLIIKKSIIDQNLPQSLKRCIMIDVDIKINDVIKNLYNLHSLGLTIKKNIKLDFPNSITTLSIIESKFTKININNIVNKANIYLLFNRNLTKINLPNESYLTIVNCNKLKQIYTNEYTIIDTYKIKKILNIELYHKYLLKYKSY